MRLSSKGRVAIVAMIDLALREHSSPVSWPSIGARPGVSR